MITKENLKQIIISQKEGIMKADNGITRDKLKEIKLIDSFAIIISGIRRCGKSTISRQILKNEKNFYYLNLEDPRLDGFELSDFNKADEIFLELYGSGGIYFFDEIQTIDKWEKYIRFLADKKSKILITGSNASLLSKELGTKLTGRHISYELFPFSYNEFLEFFNLNPNKESYERFLFEGGFPEYLEKKEDRLLNELLNDVLMRDIVSRFRIKNISTLKKLAIYLITNVGKEFSYNSLKKMLEVKSVQSIINYISYLEDAYLIFTMPLFSYSYKKQLVNAKKVYSIDNGLSSINSVSFSKDKGIMFENSVFLQLKRKYKEIFYFKKNRECDFIVKEQEKIKYAIQICYELNEDNKKREIEGLIEAMEELKLKEGLIITLNQTDSFEIGDKKIKVLPVWRWLLEE